MLGLFKKLAFWKSDEEKPVCVYKVRELFGEPKRERRLRRYFGTAELFAAYLQSLENWPKVFGRTVITDIPDDAEVYEIHIFKYGRMWIDMYHPSFDVVPEGKDVPLGKEQLGQHVWFFRQADGSYRCPLVEPCKIGELPEGLISELTAWRFEEGDRA